MTLEEVYITLRPRSYSKESLSTSQGVKFQWNSCSFGDYNTITGQKCPLTFERTLNVKFYHQRLSNTLFVLFPFPNFDWTIKLLKCSSAHPVMFWEGGTGDASSTGTRVGNQRNYLGISIQRNYLGNIWQVFQWGHMEPFDHLAVLSTSSIRINRLKGSYFFFRKYSPAHILAPTAHLKHTFPQSEATKIRVRPQRWANLWQESDWNICGPPSAACCCCSAARNWW